LSVVTEEERRERNLARTASEPDIQMLKGDREVRAVSGGKPHACARTHVDEPRLRLVRKAWSLCIRVKPGGAFIIVAKSHGRGQSLPVAHAPTPRCSNHFRWTSESQPKHAVHFGSAEVTPAACHQTQQKRRLPRRFVAQATDAECAEIGELKKGLLAYDARRRELGISDIRLRRSQVLLGVLPRWLPLTFGC